MPKKNYLDNWLKENNIVYKSNAKKRVKTDHKIDHEKVYELLNKGITQINIAKMLSCSLSSVTRIKREGKKAGKVND